MIRVLFIHQNLPGQFRRLIRHPQARPDFALAATGEDSAVKRENLGPGLRVFGYPAPQGPGEKTHRYLRHVEDCIRRGQSVTRVLADPQKAADGLDVGFDPEYPASFDDRLRIRVKNPVPMQSLLAAELGDRVDWPRAHFLGRVPCAICRSVLQISSLHMSLTYPFVLSWSAPGSNTAPVREVIEEGGNGFLADFADPGLLVARVLDLIARRSEIVRRRHDVETVDLPADPGLLEPLAAAIDSMEGEAA